MNPAFFTVGTPRARTHQEQLACMHERTGIYEPEYMLLLLLPAPSEIKPDLMYLIISKN